MVKILHFFCLVTNNQKAYLFTNYYHWILKCMERIWHTLNKAYYLDLALVSIRLYHMHLKVLTE